jgi:hypothetical protein
VEFISVHCLSTIELSASQVVEGGQRKEKTARGIVLCGIANLRKASKKQTRKFSPKQEMNIKTSAMLTKISFVFILFGLTGAFCCGRGQGQPGGPRGHFFALSLFPLNH